MDDEVVFNINVIGDNLPSKINRFDDAGFSEQMMDNIAANGYTLPTPFQKYLIPITSASRNLVAYGDCGKHEAPGFLMPIIDKLMSRPASEKTEKAEPLVIIIDPMRDSVVETHRVATKFIEGSKLLARVTFADHEVVQQEEKIQDGCDILVLTPGRLLQLDEQGKIGFGKLEVLVIDQIDTIFGEGFGKDLEKIFEKMPERQTLVFSTNFTEDVKQLADKYMPNYATVSVGLRR